MRYLHSSLRFLWAAVLVAAAAPAAAQPSAPPGPRAAALAAGERASKAAAASGDVEDFVACGMAYLDAYNAEEEHPSAPEALYNSAVCFEEGKSLGVAIGLYEQLERHPKAGKLAAPATLRMARLYERVAALDRAAAAYERYAQRAQGAPEERSALSSAVTLYAALGEDERQLAALRRLTERFGATAPREIAELVLAGTAAHERRSLAAAIKHLRAHEAILAKAEPDVTLRAQSRLAGLLWAQSCPGGGQDGLCVRAARQRTGDGAGGPITRERCGGAPDATLTVVPRSAATARLAQAQQRAAVQRFEQGADAAGWDARARHAYALAKLALADASLEAFLAVTMPSGLTFDPKQPTAAAASRKRFEAFLAAKTAAGSRARAEYDAVILAKDGLTAIAAAARIGWLTQRFADELRSAPIPAELRRGSFVQEKTATYCKLLNEVAAPLLATALEAFRACAARASDLGISSAASRLCASEVTRLDPSAQAASLEVVPAPSAAVAPLELAAVPAQLPGASDRLTAALATFHKDATWQEGGARCSDLAAAFEREASGSWALTARYLAGSTYQRCGRTIEAVAAYGALDASAASGDTPGTRALRAMARSNRGVGQWRRGDRAAATASWQAALALDAKLFATRANLAAAKLGEARDPSLPANERRKLLREASEHASAAAALSDSAAGFVLLGALALERGQLGVASHFLQRAVERDPQSPEVASFAGALAAERGDVWHLERFARAAAAPTAPDEVHLNHGLALLHLRRFSEALTALSPVTARSYEVVLARGVALRGLDRLEEAQRSYSEAIGIDAGRPEAHYNLGVLAKHYRAAKALASGDKAAAMAALIAAAEALRQIKVPEAERLALDADCERAVLERGETIAIGQGCGAR